MFLILILLFWLPVAGPFLAEIVGAVAAAGGFVLALSHVGPLLIGAFVGGLLA